MRIETPMPANLPPKYFDIEKKLKTARDSREKIEIMEELLAIIPKHKGTEKLRALYKTKIAKLRVQDKKKPATSHQGTTYTIEKSGAGQIVMLGPPNAGKSSLLKSLTGTEPKIADYPFTTHAPSPAMMKFENIQIQLVDTHPISADFIDVWHSELLKNADAGLFVLDLGAPDSRDDLLTVMAQLEEKRIEFVADETGQSSSRQIPYRRILVVANKADLDSSGEKARLLREELDGTFDMTAVSATMGTDMEELKARLFALLRVLRVYSKAPGKDVDKTDPFILPEGSTVNDLAKAVHKDFAEKLKYARSWSRRTYDGQRINRDFVLSDGDIIELHL
ncbi:MAG: 50S ribosome-binding GTPase [Acidobacteria bacterium]|nr:50S ribosome-binding GTPase [Acidobacteriota bacterium]